MDVVAALGLFGGAAHWARLRDYRVSERSLRGGVGAGLVLAVGDGGYVLPGTDPALVAAVQAGGVASHASAARLHGLSRWRPIEGIALAQVERALLLGPKARDQR